MTSKCEIHDADNLNTPKRSHKLLPLSEKVKVPNLIGKGKKKMDILKLLKSLARMNLLLVKL
jgi:hypothetical protein